MLTSMLQIYTERDSRAFKAAAAGQEAACTAGALLASVGSSQQRRSASVESSKASARM